MYKTIAITEKTLESTANAIGSNMLEGFEPTTELIQLYLDWKTNKISETDFLIKLYAIYE